MIMEQAQINIFTHTAVCADLQHEVLAERLASSSFNRSTPPINSSVINSHPECEISSFLSNDI